TAARHHRRLTPEGGRQCPALAAAKRRLSLAREQLGHGAARHGLDRGVEIDERHAEPERQQAPDRALAGAHDPHQGDRTLDSGPHDRTLAWHRRPTLVGRRIPAEWRSWDAIDYLATVGRASVRDT